MTAKDLISDIVPALRLNETGEKALNWMDIFKISHLPVIDNNNNLLGLISDTEIYDYNLIDRPIANHTLTLVRPFVQEHNHFYEVIAKVANQKLSIIPVLDDKEVYSGVITVYDLVAEFGKLTAATEPGTIFSLRLNKIDYSLSHISQLIEGNEAKILSLYTKNHRDSNKLELTIKIDQNDFSAVRQTFERYDYEVEINSSGSDKIKEMLDDRYDELMHYLDL
ncbi:MAG: CBS domain-containing protein [Bacteroidota bacterium]|nr:CBS domain-containing protein [Bacteroidota bacterium]